MTLSVEEVQWPCELSLQTKQQLMSLAKKSENIYEIGLPPLSSQFNGIAFITKGLGYLTMLNHHFESSQGIIIGENDWLGAVSVDDFDSSMIKAEEIEPIEYIYFDRNKVKQLASRNNEVYQWLFVISKRFTMKWVNQLSYQNCASSLRVLYTLMGLASYSKNGSSNVPCIRASQYQIGEISGVSRSRVSEFIQEYKKQNIINVSRACIHINQYHNLHFKAVSAGYEPIT